MSTGCHPDERKWIKYVFVFITLVGQFVNDYDLHRLQQGFQTQIDSGAT